MQFVKNVKRVFWLGLVGIGLWIGWRVESFIAPIADLSGTEELLLIGCFGLLVPILAYGLKQSIPFL